MLYESAFIDSGLHCLLFFCQVLSAQQSADASVKYASLSDQIDQIMRETRGMGLSIAIIENYDVVWAKGFGVKTAGTTDSVTTETRFQAASITKSLTAVAVMRAVQTRRITLNQDVNQQLVPWKIRVNDFTRQSPVTVQQLLSHTASVASIAFPPYGRGERFATLVQESDQ